MSSIKTANTNLAMAWSSQQVNDLPKYAIFLNDLSESNIRYKDTWDHKNCDNDKISPQGGPMGTFKAPGHICFSSFNPNGIQGDNLQARLQEMVNGEIDIQCFFETNANVLDVNVQQNFAKTTSRMFTTSTATWTTSYTTSKSEFKPGGTGIISVGKVTSRVRSTGYNRMGRWSYQILEGKGKKKILIVRVYNCCKDETQRDGTNTAFFQQKVMLKEEKRKPDPRKAFAADLVLFLHRMKQQNGNIVPIIMGDWNKSIYNTNARELFIEFGLVDVFS